MRVMQLITFGKLCCNVGAVSMEVLEASMLFTRNYGQRMPNSTY